MKPTAVEKEKIEKPKKNNIKKLTKLLTKLWELSPISKIHET